MIYLTKRHVKVWICVLICLSVSNIWAALSDKHEAIADSWKRKKETEESAIAGIEIVFSRVSDRLGNTLRSLLNHQKTIEELGRKRDAEREKLRLLKKNYSEKEESASLAAQCWEKEKDLEGVMATLTQARMILCRQELAVDNTKALLRTLREDRMSHEKQRALFASKECEARQNALQARVDGVD